MVVGFTITYAISACQRCEFESYSGEVYSIQHYVIKFVSDLRQVGGYIWFERVIKHHNHNPNPSMNLKRILDS